MKKVKSLFLLLMSGVLLLVFTTGCRSNDTATSSKVDNTESEKETKTGEMPTYKINEDIFVKNDKGEYRVKFTDVYETKERNEYSDQKADRVIIIEYEYENISLDKDLQLSEMEYKLYDKDNNQMDSYMLLSTKFPSNVSKGRKANASVAYALNNADNSVELELYDDMFSGKANCKVLLEVASAKTSTDNKDTSSANASGGSDLPARKMNEDIFITNNKGKYRVKFTKVFETKDRNSFNDVKADRVVIIEYEFENISIDDDLSVGGWDFKLYDKGNNQMEKYIATGTKYADSVSKGRKTTASVAYALNDKNNYIELEFDDKWADCKVVLEW